eukprot:1158402-Pelagomonas_calceolata.AAC.23
MPATFCSTPEQGSIKTLCPWPPLPPSHCSATLHSLLCLYAEFQGGRGHGWAKAAGVNFTVKQANVGAHAPSWHERGFAKNTDANGAKHEPCTLWWLPVSWSCVVFLPSTPLEKGRVTPEKNGHHTTRGFSVAALQGRQECTKTTLTYTRKDCKECYKC